MPTDQASACLARGKTTGSMDEQYQAARFQRRGGLVHDLMPHRSTRGLGEPNSQPCQELCRVERVTHMTQALTHVRPPGLVYHPYLCRIEARGLHEHLHLVHLRQRCVPSPTSFGLAPPHRTIHPCLLPLLLRMEQPLLQWTAGHHQNGWIYFPRGQCGLVLYS